MVSPVAVVWVLKGRCGESPAEAAHSMGLGNGTLGNGCDQEEKLGESRFSGQQMESEKGLEASCQSAVKVECNMIFFSPMSQIPHTKCLTCLSSCLN